LKSHHDRVQEVIDTLAPLTVEQVIERMKALGIQGTPSACLECPVALLLSKLSDGLVSVTSIDCRPSLDGFTYILLPVNLREVIRQVDRGEVDRAILVPVEAWRSKVKAWWG